MYKYYQQKCHHSAIKYLMLATPFRNKKTKNHDPAILRPFNLSMNMDIFSNISLYRNRNLLVFFSPAPRLRHCESRPVGMWQSILPDDTLYGLPRRYAPRN
jgi:hypothetical protein